MLSTINKRRSKIDRNSVFNCHLSSVAIKNTVSTDFLSTFLDNIGILDCCLPGVIMYYWKSELGKRVRIQQYYL